MPNQEIDPSKLLDGLKKAIPGPVDKLQGPQGLFPGGARSKPLADHAKDQGYVAERKETRPPTGRNRQSREVTVYALTDKGRQYIAEAESPRPLLEAILPLLQTIADKERETAEPQYETVVADARKQCIDSIQSAFGKLQQSIDSAMQQFDKQVTAAQPSGSTQSDELANILPLLQSVLGQSTQAPSSKLEPKVDPPEPPHIVDEESTDVRKIIKDSYDYLCRMKQFHETKLVELPWLFSEAKDRIPSLTIVGFHDALQDIEKDGLAQLMVINETHDAKRKEYALLRNDRLYYYILWK